MKSTSSAIRRRHTQRKCVSDTRARGGTVIVSVAAMLMGALLTYNALSAYSAGQTPTQWLNQSWRPLLMTAVASAALAEQSDIVGTELDDHQAVIRTNKPVVPKDYRVAAGRSPIPQPGELFARPIAARKLTDRGARTEKSAPKQPVHWRHAGHHVQQTITVYGKVVDTYMTDTVCILNFADHWRGMFRVIITKEMTGAWPEHPESYFLGRSIRVKGKVTVYDGKPQIRVKDKSQVISIR